MNRRNFMKSLGLYGSSVLIPSMLGGTGLISQANALGISKRKIMNARAIILDEIQYVKPAVMPQVISIFLYGGPSELAGNLTNIEEINANSQNPYAADLMPDADNTRVTKNSFWGGNNDGNAGGEIMEDMIEKGRMSIYRTIHRIKDDSRAHRPSIFSNLTGVIGMEDSRPGIGTNLASILSANEVIADDAIFPFVTFESDPVIFNQGDTSLSLNLKPISLNQDLRNPYERARNGDLSDQDEIIEALAQQALSAGSVKYQKVVDAFTKRSEIETFVNRLKANLDNEALPPDPDINPADLEEDEEVPLIEYPNTNFGNRLKAAIKLTINNPDTLFVSLGTDGLGGWDDHNSAQEEYPDRMLELMRSLNAAAKHLEFKGKDNVVITVYGDFGRNVNLNNSMGWDHGNNQNLYTVGANPTNAAVLSPDNATGGIEGRQLGKVVGKTMRTGKANENRQFTVPTDDSYQCEPFSISSTIYKYFGVQNPEALTDEPIIDETATNEWVARS